MSTGNKQLIVESNAVHFRPLQTNAANQMQYINAVFIPSILIMHTMPCFPCPAKQFVQVFFPVSDNLLYE
jgi:hypothetical protein